MRLVRPGFRPAWAEVDLAAIRHNVARVRAASHPALVCAVVKADAYGHGAVPVARAALDAGASWLAVALVEEGVELRETGIGEPVLVLSEPPADAMSEVVHRRLVPTLYTKAGVDAAEAAAEAAGVRHPVHVKVDTGMHRVGADPAVAVALARRIASSPWLSFDGLYTHLAVADDPDRDAVTKGQLDILQAVRNDLAAQGARPRLLHAANSAGALLVAAHHDLVRVGIAVYGYEPNPDHDSGAGLVPALAWKARVSHVRRLPPGEGISYGLAYTTTADTVIATVPLGYADGVPRRSGEAGAFVLVGGRRVPIAGRVTMDQLMVDCGPGADVAAGDEVVLIGRQGDQTITADDWAGWLGTISYEVLCSIGARVPRVHLGA